MSRYLLVRRLAIGSTAEVFLGSTVGGAEARPVAVKRLLPGLADDPKTLRRFWREARLATAVRHHGLVSVLDHGITADGGAYLVMELVDGADLRGILEGAAARGLHVGLREAGAIVLAVADALGYLHAARDPQGKPLGIVHRNVNPANVLVSRRGEVKLGDLGLARLGADQSVTRATVVGHVEPGYLAPEQAMGRKVDARTDVFLAGVLFYELLAGKPLFAGANPLALVRGFDVARLPEIPDVPPPVRQVLERALAREPSQRYGSAKELADDLGRFLEGKRLRGRPDDVAALLSRALPSRPSLVSLGADEHAGEIELARPPPLPRGSPVARPAGPKKLGEILVEKANVDPAHVAEALARQRAEGGKLGEHLKEAGVSELDLIRALSVQTGIPFVGDDKLDGMEVPRDLVGRLPKQVAARLAAVPLLLKQGALFVAMMDPRDAAALAELKKVCGVAAVRGVFATEGALDRALRRFWAEPAAREESTGVVDMRELGMEPGGPIFHGTERMLDAEALSGEASPPPVERAPPPVAPPRAKPEPESPLGPVVLAGALRALGGVATEGATLGALARRIAVKLGAPASELAAIESAAAALAIAARFEGREAFERPAQASLRAVFGASAAPLHALLSLSTRDLAAGRASSPAAQALACAAAFAEAAGTSAPPPEIASFALSEVEHDERLGKDALAALAAVVADAHS